MIAAMIASALITLSKPLEVNMPEPTYITSMDGRKIDITSSDIDLIERCVMSEAGGESDECQRMVATVILNRVACRDKFPDSVPGVIYDQNQFSIHNNGQPNIGVRLNVLAAITLYDGQRIPYQLYYFRNSHYHNFEIPYKKIDNTYFSLADNVLL